MRLDGDGMIVSIKDSVKLFGISIMTCCAVTVCNLFLNYYLDLTAIADLIDNPYAQMFYDAQIMTAKVVCAVSGGCLAITTIVMLFFYIKHYIDSHSKEIGGTGLGLSIARNAVLMHRGSIDVQSKLDEGTTFTISIPLTAAAVNTTAK